MKKLIDTVEVHELRAKRALFLKRARKLEDEAAQFRKDAAKAGMQLQLLGEPIYKEHPIYHDEVLPALRAARKVCLDYGFDFIYVTRTPLSGQPNFAHLYAGAVTQFTPTMQRMVDVIRDRPELDALTGEEIPAEQPQQQVSDNSENS